MLDLNKPEHAREYIQTWIELGKLMLGDDEAKPMNLDDGTPEDHLRLARQLFLYCDPRPVVGSLSEPL